MSRIRSIHPGLWTDDAFVPRTPFARLLFMGIWNECDDQGIFQWSPLRLKMRILPADNISAGELMAELEAAECIRKFEVDGKPFGAVRNFCKFQRPKKPNAVFPATAEIRAFTGDNSEAVGNRFPPAGEKPAQREEGRGKREKKISPNGESPDLRPEHIMKNWNELASKLGKPQVRELTATRRQLLKARITQHPIADFVEVLDKIERSAFLRGDTGWHGGGFDWVFKAANFQKILEGNYDQ